MVQEAEDRLRAKYISIGRNMGRKEANEAQRAERQQAHKAGIKKGRKIERKRQTYQERRKKWDWKYRVFSVRTVVTIAGSVVVVKLIDLAMMYLGQ